MLHLWVLVLLLLLFGAFSVFGFAATQSLLPQIVERRALRAANARLDQAEAGAQTAGPAIGGLLVGLVGAPLAIAVDAVTYVVDAVLIAGLRVRESRQPNSEPRSVRREVVEGLAGRIVIASWGRSPAPPTCLAGAFAWPPSWASTRSSRSLAMTAPRSS